MGITFLRSEREFSKILHQFYECAVLSQYINTVVNLNINTVHYTADADIILLEVISNGHA